MALFFINIEEFKRTGVAGAADNDDAFLVSLEAMLVHAQDKHLAPWLGPATLNTLSALHPDAAVGSPKADLTALIQRALAWLALYEYSFVSTVRHNENGMKMVDGIPYRYIATENREKCLEVGYEALEACLVYLDTHLTVFTDWRDGVERLKHKAVFLNTAAAFRLAYSAKINRYTFDLLRGVVEDVEYQAIERLLPQQFLTSLRTKFFANAQMTTPVERQLIFLIQKAVAAFTISEAMHRNFVELNNGEVVQVSARGDQNSKTLSKPQRSDMERAAWHSEGWANAHLGRLKQFISANIVAFPLCFSLDSGGTNTDGDAWGQKPTIVDTQNREPKRNKAAIL
jgi:hypothetical protein